LSKNVAIFIDVANLYYSARGQDVDVDYVALLKAATKGRDLIRAYAYSGLDPENENQRKFIDFLTKNGYRVVHKDIRKFGDGRVKANLDIELVVDLFRLQDRMDIAVIVSGDGDFAPAIRALQDGGVRCEVISFRPNTSSDLLAVADEFTDIMKIASISREKGALDAKGMGAPPMPAKEVEPEFGFRDASPAVAAAALAAIRGGATTRGGRTTRGRTTRRRGESAEPADAQEIAGTPAISEMAAEVAVPETNGQALETNGDAQESGEAKRRRRRRGGRGRGRRGHTESGETTDTLGAPAGAEIGWQEFDDLGQIDDLGEDRAYTFEEADAETLAELGLLEGTETVAVATDDAPVTETKPRRARTRKAAAPTEAAPAEPPAEAVSEAPKARRSRSRATVGGASAPAETASEEARPRRSRARKPAQESPDADAFSDQAADATPPRARRRSPAAVTSAQESPSPDEDGEPQGIWGRFRSARTPRS